MIKIGDIIKDQIFPDCKPIKVDEILDTPFELLGVAARTGADGDYWILKCRCKNKMYSFSNGGKVILEKVNEICKYFNQTANNENNRIVLFKEPVLCKLISTQSEKSKRYYYDFADVE